MLAVNGIIGTWAGPDEPGTAYVMLHHSIGDVGDGHLGSWGFQQGGMGAVSDSIRRAAESYGCEIRTDAQVQKVLTTGGRFAGVVLEKGEELRAPLGVTCIHPKIAFLDLIGREELPADFVWDIERWRTRSGVVKINVAMSELPDFIADPGKELQDHHGLGGALFHAAVRGGGVPGLPHGAEGLGPALRGRRDPDHPGQEARPRGRPRVLDVHAVVPDDWNLEPHRDELEQYADGSSICTRELAPNFKTAVIDRQVLGPYDMEQELGLIGEHLPRELSDQLFHMRPAPGYADYRTPIRACTTAPPPHTRVAASTASPAGRRIVRP